MNMANGDNKPVGSVTCAMAAVLGAVVGGVGLPIAYIMLFGVVLRIPSDGLEIPFLVLPLGLFGGGALAYRWARRSSSGF